jgi:hypothetical protein
MQRRNFLRLSALGAIGLSVGAWLGWKPATVIRLSYDAMKQAAVVHRLPANHPYPSKDDKPVYQISNERILANGAECDEFNKLLKLCNPQTWAGRGVYVVGETQEVTALINSLKRFA